MLSFKEHELMVSPLKSTKSNGALSSPKFGCGIKTGLLHFLSDNVRTAKVPKIRLNTIKPFSS